jgi:hypothetical protein
MPKEQINRSEWKKILLGGGLPGEEEKGIEHGTIEPEVYVRWTPDSFVQLSMAHYETVPWSTLRADDFGNPSSWPASSDTFSGVLDRPEINKLIRTLRRARDAAYGRDE